MNLVNSALQFAAWHNAITKAKNSGFAFIVSVKNAAGQRQLHYYKIATEAAYFYKACTEKVKYWSDPLPPMPIKEALRNISKITQP